jgi:hypothetical protein
MSPKPSPKILFGSGGTGALSKEEMRERLDILDRYNVKDIDTAWLYVRLSLKLDNKRNIAPDRYNSQVVK